MAIKGEELPAGYDPAKCEDLATSLEEAIFNNFKQTNPKYKNKVRSRVFNLKDKKNYVLRDGLLLGSITPGRLAVMTSAEMASDEVKKEREAYFSTSSLLPHCLSHLNVVLGQSLGSTSSGFCRRKRAT